MPELPEIEVLRLGLEPVLVGQSLVSIKVRSIALREPIDKAALERACWDNEVLSVGRRAKYLLIGLRGGQALVVHLGMSGRLYLADREEPAAKHEHAVIQLSSGRTLRFRDPRRFGLLLVIPQNELETDRHFSHLGVEPLADPGLGSVLWRKSRGRRAPVKNFLMDARVVVGVGNIYASEALFEAGVHPLRAAGRISAARWERLGEATRAVLTRAIGEGGTTLQDFRNAEGAPGYFQVSLAVYGREGAACLRCGRPIKRVVLAGRSTFYCGSCQR